MTPEQVREILDENMRALRAVKEDAVRRRGVDGPVWPEIEVWRDGRPITVVTSNGDRPAVTEAIQLAIGGFRADLIVMTFDAWWSPGVPNPDTGREFEPGEHEEYVRRHGRGNGVVLESLNVGLYTTDGNVAGALMPFEPVESAFGGVKLRWEEATIFSPDWKDNGHFADVIKEAFARLPALKAGLQELRAAYKADLGASVEEADAFLDASITKQLQAAPPPGIVALMLMCGHDQAGRRRVLQRVLKRRLSDSVRGALEIDANVRAAPWN